MVLWLLAAVRAAAVPAERPPPDFAGRQFIDSAGCAYLRNGNDWLARLDLDGTPLCGYPPTFAPKGVEARIAAPDPALAMPGMGEAEARLTAAVTGAMREGDWLAGHPPEAAAPAAGPAPQAGARPAAGPAGDGSHAPIDLDFGPKATRADLYAGASAAPLDQPLTRPLTQPSPGISAEAEAGAGDSVTGRQIAAALTAVPAIASTGAGALHPDRRLCALLGAEPVGSASGVFGLDVTGGYCTSPRAPRTAAPDPVAVATLPAATPVAPVAPAAVAGTMREASATATKGRAGTPAARAAEAPRRQSAAAPRRDARPSAQAMIPAGARWLEVGRFSDPAAADAATARLKAAGQPTARAKGGKAIAVLAGPYASRQAIVEARDRLVRAGWRGIVPR